MPNLSMYLQYFFYVYFISMGGLYKFYLPKYLQFLPKYYSIYSEFSQYLPWVFTTEELLRRDIWW